MLSAAAAAAATATAVRAARPGVASVLARSVSSSASATATAVPEGEGHFEKILVANRGEIACRVFRTARALGIKTVAVYSEADRHAMHVQAADEAYCIGPAASADSYLRVDKILEVAQRSGAQAIHPGYGFLSENAGFARACEQAGIVFIGPPASAIEDMGSKDTSKIIMEKAGVACVPGYHGEEQDLDTLSGKADDIGYPVLIKAVKGGGGRGMRICHQRSEIHEALDSAKREALAAFGDDRVLVEKYISIPRHIELQVFADKHGNAVHLFERDCSVQRRHQKVIEEAPAPHMTQQLRDQMGDAAVAAARAVGYVGAGTVEFILDTETNEFYFMEMNTRLQVEHPVTELVTQQDLVQWQLLVAAGHPLPITQQQELKLHGHAFEARIYAEDPDNNFLPCSGTLQHLSFPSESPAVRVDTGFAQGDQVSVFYDPMIAKLIVNGPTREMALQQMRRALENLHVVGLATNIEFCHRLSSHPEFIAGNVATNFIPLHKDQLLPEAAAREDVPAHVRVLAALADVLTDQAAASQDADLEASCDATSPLLTLPDFRLNHAQDAVREYTTSSGEDVHVPVVCRRDGSWQIGDAEVAAAHISEDGVVHAEIDGRRTVTRVVPDDEGTLHVFDGGRVYKLLRRKASYAMDAAADPYSMLAPMPGKITKVIAAAGDTVSKGDAIVVLEAMKMEHTVRAPQDGVLGAVHFAVGAQVDAKVVLASLKHDEDA